MTGPFFIFDIIRIDLYKNISKASSHKHVSYTNHLAMFFYKAYLNLKESNTPIIYNPNFRQFILTKEEMKIL